MRRSMVGMSLALTVLSTPLAAQAMWSLGLAATLGGGWQIEGADVSFSHSARGGPFRRLGVGARFGSFIDEGAIIGGAQGFVSGLTLSARTGALSIADVGAENNPTTVGLDLTVEVAGYLGSHSPLPQGGRWMGASVLPGLRFGGGDNGRFSIVIGPTVFFGHTTDVHGFLGIRFEMPLARR